MGMHIRRYQWGTDQHLQLFQINPLLWHHSVEIAAIEHIPAAERQLMADQIHCAVIRARRRQDRHTLEAYRAVRL
jgi:hypothetical protein